MAEMADEVETQAAAARPRIPVRRPRLSLSPSEARSETPSKAPPEAGDATAAGIPRYWWGGDPFRTHFADALSSTFPFGEAFFVRSVRRYADRIGDPRLRADVAAFAGQEGQHSRLHDEHVSLLLDQGYRALATRNRIVDRILRWQNRRAPRASLAVTAALEHLTAILARQLLDDVGGWTGDMHPEMRRLWRWHALEEAEHKAVAFDVLQRVAPSPTRRRLAMLLNTFGLAIEILERMVYMLWKDGRLFDRGVWSGGWRFLFGRGGFLRGAGADYRAWYRRDFHPDQLDDRARIARHAPLIDAEIDAEIDAKIAG